MTVYLEQDSEISVIDTPITLKGRLGGAYTAPVNIDVNFRTSSNWGLSVTTVVRDDGTFTITRDPPPNAYDVTVTVTDADGVTATASHYVVRLITDRTAEDVERIKTLLKTPFQSWTDAEREQFVSGIVRGLYRHTDMNRVTAAVEQIVSELRQYGYSVSYTTVEPGAGRTDWRAVDIPSAAQTQTYLSNVRRLRTIVAPTGAPQVPSDMDAMGYTEANNIEKLLVLIDALLLKIKKSFWYSGEIYSGER